MCNIILHIIAYYNHNYTIYIYILSPVISTIFFKFHRNEFAKSATVVISNRLGITKSLNSQY